MTTSHEQIPERERATRLSLLSRIKDRADHKSWADFYDTYRRLIYGMAVRAGLSVEEAEDALQETIISIAGGIEKYDPARAPFRAWLGLITKRRIVDQFRKRPRGMNVGEATDTMLESTDAMQKKSGPADSEFDSIWDEEWRNHVIEAALEEMKQQVSVKHYQIFYLRVIKKQPVGTVAKGLGVRLPLVYLVVHRLSGRFKEALQRAESNEL